LDMYCMFGHLLAHNRHRRPQCAEAASAPPCKRLPSMQLQAGRLAQKSKHHCLLVHMKANCNNTLPATTVNPRPAHITHIFHLLLHSVSTTTHWSTQKPSATSHVQPPPPTPRSPYIQLEHAAALHWSNMCLLQH
jgi:hypothetical protein